MSDEPGLTPLSSVHASLAALRALARSAKSLEEWRRVGRFATPEEVALSEQERKAWHCTGHSARTGVACTSPRVTHMQVCRRHGGSLANVKRKAAERLAAMVDPMLGRLHALALQDKHLPAAVNAAKDLLDRGGIGAEQELKLHAIGRQGQDRITVNIGFLQHPGTQQTIVVPLPPGRTEE